MTRRTKSCTAPASSYPNAPASSYPNAPASSYPNPSASSYPKVSASRYPKASAWGLSSLPQKRASAPGVCLRSIAQAASAAAVFTLAASLSAQQPVPSNAPVAKPALPDVPTVQPITSFTPEIPTTATGLPPTVPARSAPTGLAFRYLIGPFRRPVVPPLFPGNGERLRALVRDGKLFLTVRDAILLAIENNLDVEVERYNLLLADTDRLRAAGGGSLRGIDFTIQEPPNGNGGPGSPLLNTTAANPNPTTPTVTDLTSLNATAQLTTNLSGASTATAQYSTGPAVPLFDPSLFLQSGYLRRSNTVTLGGGTGTGGTTGTGTGTSASGGTVTQAQPLTFIVANLSYLQGFHAGTQITATANNDASVLYGSTSQRDPFSTPSTSVTVTQPLLRGFGSVNTRYIRIANENRKVSRLLFEQQVLETVYGVSRLYFDLVSLGENVRVNEEALRASRKLREDDAQQVIEGTLAPIELTRVSALVSSSEFALTQARGLYRQQEVILRNQILRADSPIFAAGFTEIVPTDRIIVPALLEDTPVSDLIQQGLARRPDLAQSELQIKTGQISVDAARKQALPQLNVYANVETRGSSEQSYEQIGTQGTGIPTVPLNFATAGLRVSTIAQAGIQLNLPIRNRIAEADAARDTIQLRQVQARTEKLSNQIRQNIENDTIALDTAFAAYKAAEASRGYQEQLLAAERDKLEFGQSTPLAVVQDEAYLTQAKSTEIAARSNYQKARIELDRDLGDLLEKNGISIEDAVQGTVKQ